VPASGGSFLVSKVNLSAVVDPVGTDDSASGYAVGSKWLNTTDGKAFTCFSASVGAAVWKQDTNSGQLEQIGNEAPKEHFFGNLLHYPSSGALVVNIIQYIRVWFTAGLQFGSLRVFQNIGGNPVNSFRMGIYDQTDSTDETLSPNSRVAQTALTVSSAVDDGTFVDVALGSTYTVPVTGYYWLAIVQTNSNLKFAVSALNRAGYLPRREQIGPGGGALPVTPSGLSNPVSSLIYMSALEV
jgi:hypothetical protein